MQKYLVNTVYVCQCRQRHYDGRAGVLRWYKAVIPARYPDKIGRRTSMLCFARLRDAFHRSTFMLQNVTSPYAAFALVMRAWLIVSFSYPRLSDPKAEMFPAQVRARASVYLTRQQMRYLAALRNMSRCR